MSAVDSACYGPNPNLMVMACSVVLLLLSIADYCRIADAVTGSITR